MTSRDPAQSTTALRPQAAQSPPAVCCDCCEFPMGDHEIARAPDGAILGLLTCSLCVEDALATRTLEPQTL